MNRILLIAITFFIGCGQSQENKKPNTNDSNTTNNNSKLALLENIKLAINPTFQDWVLFENGTYIIFDKADTIKDIKTEALRLMKAYGPVYAGSSAGDFGVTHLNKTSGWVVSGQCYGMYTYVNPAEIETDNPNDLTIGLLGRSKRDKDGKNPVIVHINRKK